MMPFANITRTEVQVQENWTKHLRRPESSLHAFEGLIRQPHKRFVSCPPSSATRIGQESQDSRASRVPEPKARVE